MYCLHYYIQKTTIQFYMKRKATSRCSIVVSIPACHAGDPGSIPGNGVDFFIHEFFRVCILGSTQNAFCWSLHGSCIITINSYIILGVYMQLQILKRDSNKFLASHNITHSTDILTPMSTTVSTKRFVLCHL